MSETLLDVLRAMGSASTQCYSFAKRIEEAIIADGERRKRAADTVGVQDGDFIAAVKRLAFAARTSGGTAGRDDGLCAALDTVETMLAAPQLSGLVVDEAMVQRAHKILLAGDSFTARSAVRAALTAALIPNAQQGDSDER